MEEVSKVKIFRYEPGTDESPRYDSYEIPFRKDQTILDSLKYIQKTHDRSLAFRGECGYQMCGTCGVRMNGKSCLACNTAMTKDMVIDPLLDIPVIKDLVVDRSWMYARVNPAKPFLNRTEAFGGKLEAIQPDTYDLYSATASCIECYVCTAGCPLHDQGTNPSAAVKISRVALDWRDNTNRLDAIADAMSKCVLCKTCAGRCPVNVRVDRVIMRDKQKLAAEKGIPLWKKAAITMLNYPSILWVMVRLGYPFRGLVLGRDGADFPPLTEKAFHLGDEKGGKK